MPRPGAFITCLAALGMMLAPATSNAQRPNIVFVMADDLDTATVLRLLDKGLMPHVQSHFVEQGLHFVNHVAALPVCGPSRSSLLAGRYPHNTVGRPTPRRAASVATERADCVSISNGASVSCSPSVAGLHARSGVT